MFVSCDSAGCDSSVDGDASVVERDADRDCTGGTGNTLL